MSHIQVNLSNGKSSTLFQARNAPNSELKTLNLSDASAIRKIQGTNTNNVIFELNFKKADGQEIGKIQTGHEPRLDTEEVIASDEEIIGVYGKFHNNVIGSLSMIVWKPYKP